MLDQNCQQRTRQSARVKANVQTDQMRNGAGQTCIAQGEAQGGRRRRARLEQRRQVHGQQRLTALPGKEARGGSLAFLIRTVEGKDHWVWAQFGELGPDLGRQQFVGRVRVG